MLKKRTIVSDAIDVRILLLTGRTSQGLSLPSIKVFKSNGDVCANHGLRDLETGMERYTAQSVLFDKSKIMLAGGKTTSALPASSQSIIII